MRDEPAGRTRKLRRAEIISLSAAFVIFIVVAVLGAIVWLRSSESTPAAPVATGTAPPTRVAEPRPTASPVEAAPPVPIRPVVEMPVARSPNPIDLIPDWPDDRPVGVLLLGLDRRPGERVARTDAMVLVRVEPSNRTATLISIPRDLCVANCSTSPYRINTVWEAEGPASLASRVAGILGVQVDYWVTLDFPGFRRLVDFFGGVDVEVQRAIYDPTFPNATDTGFDPFYVEAGMNHFDGQMALNYVRTRHQDGSFARDLRQQELLLALKEQMLSPQMLVQSPALLRELSNAFETNVPLDAAPSLGKLVLQIGADRMVRGNLEPERGMLRPVISESGAYVLQPNVPLIQAYTAELMRQSESLAAPDAETPEPVQFADRQHLEP